MKFISVLLTCVIAADSSKRGSTNSTADVSSNSARNWKNMEDIYLSYSKDLLKLFATVDLAPKGTSSERLLEAVLTLAASLNNYAVLSPDKNHIEAEMRTLFTNLFTDLKSLQTKSDVEEYISDESSSYVDTTSSESA